MIKGKFGLVASYKLTSGFRGRDLDLKNVGLYAGIYGKFTHPKMKCPGIRYPRQNMLTKHLTALRHCCNCIPHVSGCIYVFQSVIED